MDPVVSIVIPTYQRADVIGDAVESALNQTYPACEVVVVDDGSTDSTAEVLAPYSDRITLIHQDHKEKSAARNRGIREATGDYVAFLDSDDLLVPESIRCRVERAIETGADVVYGPVARTELNGAERKAPRPRRFPEGRVFPDLLLDRFCYIIGIMARRDAIDRVGGFQPELTHGEDTDLLLRLACHFDYAHVPEVVAVERNHPGRSRREYHRILEQGTLPTDILFDWPDLPEEYRSFEHEARTIRYLTLARVAYRVGHMSDCRSWYRRAVRNSPKWMLSPQVLRRYLWSFIRKGE